MYEYYMYFILYFSIFNTTGMSHLKKKSRFYLIRQHSLRDPAAILHLYVHRLFSYF
jgi:hypothetical protein